MNVMDHLISGYGKKFGNQMPFGYKSFYHLNSELLVFFLLFFFFFLKIYFTEIIDQEQSHISKRQCLD